MDSPDALGIKTPPRVGNLWVRWPKAGEPPARTVRTQPLV
jgi:hypothetical protein